MVPSALRTWFVIHFVADVVFAIPLMIAPVFFLELLGWQSVDPLSTRLVAAALIGIGVESLLGRNQPVEAFQTMLRLKILWSASATIGILWTMLEGGPPMGWAFLAIFGGFHLVWVYWYRRVRGESR